MKTKRENQTEEEKEKDRQRYYGRKRKQSQTNDSTCTLPPLPSTPQSIGRAVARVEKSLPTKLTLKQEVLHILTKKYCLVKSKLQ